jgi:hypothetical protein
MMAPTDAADNGTVMVGDYDRLLAHRTMCCISSLLQCSRVVMRL